MRQELVNFMTPTPRGDNFGVKSIKFMSSPQRESEKLCIYGIVMMTKEGSTKIVNFMNPRARILVLRHGRISHIVKMHYFFFTPGHGSDKLSI